MSRVQSIERAFAVLAALADGPRRRDRGRRAGRPAEVDRRPAARVARARGRRRAGARARPATGSARGSWRWRPASARPAASSRSPGRISSSSRRRVGEAAGLSVPDGRDVHYVDQVDTPTRTRSGSATGPARASRCTPSRPGWCSSPTCRRRRVERFLAEPLAALHRRGRSPTRRPSASGSARSRSTATPGSATSSPMGIISVAAGDRRRGRRGRRRGPRPRPVVPLPAARPRGRARPQVATTADADHEGAAPGRGLTRDATHVRATASFDVPAAPDRIMAYLAEPAEPPDRRPRGADRRGIGPPVGPGSWSVLAFDQSGSSRLHRVRAAPPRGRLGDLQRARLRRPEWNDRLRAVARTRTRRHSCHGRCGGARGMVGRPGQPADLAAPLAPSPDRMVRQTA